MPLSSKIIKKVYQELEDFPVESRRIIDISMGDVHEDHLIVKKAKEEAQKIIDDAQKKAEEIINEAKNKADNIKMEAYKEGFQKGKEEALAEAHKEAEEIYLSAREVFQQAEKIRRNIYRETEGELAELAVEIAEKLVCRQLDLIPETMTDIVKTACQQAKESTLYIVYVNPENLEMLKAKRKEIISELDSPARMQVIADPSIALGDCRIETEEGYIEANLKDMLGKLGLAVKGGVL